MNKTKLSTMSFNQYCIANRSSDMPQEAMFHMYQGYCEAQERATAAEKAAMKPDTSLTDTGIKTCFFGVTLSAVSEGVGN